MTVLLQTHHEALMSIYKDKEAGSYVPNSASSSWKDRKREEKELIDTLLDHFSKCRQPGLKAKITHRNIQNIFLLKSY